MSADESKLESASQYLKQGRYLHAIQIYKSLLDNPQLKRISFIKLIEIYDIQNQVDIAIRTFEDYLKENSDENVRTYFAQYLIKHERYMEAHEILSGLSHKEQTEKNFLMGIVNFYLGDYKVAEINFNEYILQNKRAEFLPEAYLYLAKCSIELQDLDTAIKNIQRSDELSTDNYEVCKTYAIIYYQKEMYFHAQEKIQRAITLNPSGKDLLEWSGKIFYKMGEYEKAKRELELFLTNYEPTSEVLALLGMTYIKQKKYAKAGEYFDLSLDLNPKNEMAYQGKQICKEEK